MAFIHYLGFGQQGCYVDVVLICKLSSDGTSKCIFLDLHELCSPSTYLTILFFVDPATRELYAECTRLEREIFQYKSRNQIIKNLLCKLAESYENSKAHVLHIWGRFKELRSMIREVIDSDV